MEREFAREMQLRLTRTPNLETRSSSSSICPRRRAIACRSAHTFAMRVWCVAVAERSKRLNTECTEARVQSSQRESEKGTSWRNSESGGRADICESGGKTAA